jgi:hypothetical protein
MSIIKSTLDVFASRRRRVFEKYEEAAPPPSQPPQHRLGFHASKLCEYAAMYSEAAYVAGKQSLSFAGLRDNDMFLAIEAAATALKTVADESGLLKTHAGAEQLVQAILSTVQLVKEGKKSLTTTPRTLDLFCLAAISLKAGLASQPPQSVQLPKRLLDLVSQLRLPVMQSEQPVLANLAELLADDAKAMLAAQN